MAKLKAEDILPRGNPEGWRWSDGSTTGIITRADLLKLYQFLTEAAGGRTTAEMAAFLAVPGMTHRKADRSVQLLSRAGLARYDGPERRWIALEMTRG